MLSFLWFIIKFIFWTLLFIAFITAFTTHFILWFELRLKSLQGELPDRIPYLKLLKNLFIETACYFARPWLSPLAFLPSNVSTDNNKAIPVLLVHGYLQNKTDWIWFKRKLKAVPEIGPLYALNLFPAFCSITHHADRLKKEIEWIKTETKQNKIILVGHSMGGIVSSYYSEYLAKPGEVEKVITLGSPFQGTRLAALGIGDCIKEMTPHSSFLDQLTQQIQNSSSRYHYIGSKIDNLIIPWSAAFPPHQSLLDRNLLILEDHGHLRLLISPVVIHQVATWITKPSL